MVNLPHFAMDKSKVSPRMSFASLVDKVQQEEYRKNQQHKEKMPQMFGARRFNQS